MAQFISPSAWATLRFRRAKDVRGWALLGIPAPLYPQVMQQLFEHQARFIEKHAQPFPQGEFINLLFEAPVTLAARLALTFPAPAGEEVLSVNEAGDRLIYGKAAQSPKARLQAAACGPSLSVLARQMGFWQAVEASVASQQEFELGKDITQVQPSSKREASDLETNDLETNNSGASHLETSHLKKNDDEGWEEDEILEDEPDLCSHSEDHTTDPSDPSDPSPQNLSLFEDVWIEQESDWVETEETPPEVNHQPSMAPMHVMEMNAMEDDGAQTDASPLREDAAVAVTSLENSEKPNPEILQENLSEPIVSEGPPEDHPAENHPWKNYRSHHSLDAIENPQTFYQLHSVTPTAVTEVLGAMTIGQVLNQPSEPSLQESVLQGNANQIEILKQGAAIWNLWRDRHLDIRPSLRGAYLNHLDLRGADLRDADLRFAFLFRADLRGADLRGASLLGADLIHADLSGADLRDAFLSGAYLSHANLTQTNLAGSDLRGTFLYGATFHQTVMPNGEWASE